jgi:8-oxo-dGTP diphosphatase
MKTARLSTKTATDIVFDIVSAIHPFDALEEQHIKETLTWIQSGTPIFRIAKPDVPPKHLVSYFVLFDKQASKILLVDHKKALLWLPAGGHVEINEDPKETVKRECFEELGIEADFWSEEPMFLTSTVTVGLTAGHTDISLWYVLRGNHGQEYCYDRDEFNQIRWFHFNEIPYEKCDPHMKRFMQKLQKLL